MIRATVTAMAWQLGRSKGSLEGTQTIQTFDAEAVFLLRQMDQMPDYLRWPFRMVTLVYGMHTILLHGRLFHALTPEQKDRVIRRWKHSKISFMSTFIRFFEGLVTVHVYARQ
jgi:hypothetical protein